MNDVQQEVMAGRKKFLDRFPRIGGAIFLFLGLVLGFIGFYFPIHDALQGADRITKSSKATFVAVALTILGSALIVLGPIATRLSEKFLAMKGWKQKAIIALLVIPLILAAILVDHFFDKYLESFGYRF